MYMKTFIILENYTYNIRKHITFNIRESLIGLGKIGGLNEEKALDFIDKFSRDLCFKPEVTIAPECFHQSVILD